LFLEIIIGLKINPREESRVPEKQRLPGIPRQRPVQKIIESLLSQELLERKFEESDAVIADLDLERGVNLVFKKK